MNPFSLSAAFFQLAADAGTFILTSHQGPCRLVVNGHPVTPCGHMVHDDVMVIVVVMVVTAPKVIFDRPTDDVDLGDRNSGARDGRGATSNRTGWPPE